MMKGSASPHRYKKVAQRPHPGGTPRFQGLPQVHLCMIFYAGERQLQMFQNSLGELLI